LGGELVSDVQVVVYLLVGLMALAGTIGTAVLAARQKGLTDLVGALQTEVERLRDKASDNEARIARLERRDRAWADYVHQLRAHIVAQKPPPPPEWPAGLDV
jgi:hypothetical protein